MVFTLTHQQQSIGYSAYVKAFVKIGPKTLQACLKPWFNFHEFDTSPLRNNS